MWRKTTIETALTEGHALGWADFDGDGSDELVAGWRRGPKAGRRDLCPSIATAR